MRQLYPALAVWVLSFSLVNSAWAQMPPAALDYEVPLVSNDSGLAAWPPPSTGLEGPLWNVNLLLGFPTGVRVQRSLDGGAGRDWLVEGFAGLDLIFPIAGGGIRWRWAHLNGPRDYLAVGPGIDLYVAYNSLYGTIWLNDTPATFGIFTMDVEILWHHAFNDRCASELGVNIGAGRSFPGQGTLVPVVSLEFGLRF